MTPLRPSPYTRGMVLARSRHLLAAIGATLLLLVAMVAGALPASGQVAQGDPLAPLPAPGEPSATDLPRLLPDPFVVELAATPDPVPVEALIRAGFELSGDRGGALDADIARLTGIVREVRRAVGSISDPYERGEAVLEYMFEHLLTSYDATQARLDLLLQTGRYNCVSSAVLYLILGRAVGLRVEGAYTPDHAFCTVDTGTRTVDVETTNRYGFDPGTKKDFRTAFGQTGFAYVPPGDYLRRHATDGKGLLSFILQDRMALLERQRDFARAVGLAIDRHALLKSRRAYDDGANEIANYCSALNAEGRYGEAIDFVRRAIRDYGPAQAIMGAAGVLVQNQVAALANASSYPKAIATIQEALSDRWISEGAATTLREGVVAQQVVAEGKSLPLSEAVAAATASYRAGELAPAFYQSYLLSLYVSEAQRVAASGDYLRAAAVLAEGQRLVDDPRLAQGRQIYLQDYAAAIHNRFASLYNAGRPAAAIPLLREGLAHLPDNPMLARDLEMAEAAAKRENAAP